MPYQRFIQPDFHFEPETDFLQDILQSESWILDFAGLPKNCKSGAVYPAEGGESFGDDMETNL